MVVFTVIQLYLVTKGHKTSKKKAYISTSLFIYHEEGMGKDITQGRL